MMFASFHSNGTTPSFNDKLNTLASGILICSTVSISNFGGIVISHVTALDPSEPSTRLTRSAPGDNITAKQYLRDDNRG